MNVSILIKQYFASSNLDMAIDVFDEKNIYTVYQRVMTTLTKHINIETSLLQALNYCLYEILDNVLTHSGKELGTVITHYNPEKHTLGLLVADDGQGIHKSLSGNEKYATLTEPESLEMCIRDSVTDGKGMGFGLYTTFLLARDAALRFDIRSGNHTLSLQEGNQTISTSEPWQGTIVYLQLRTNKEIDPERVVANRTNVAEQYNEVFLNDNELEELW
jgi:anti-sigma regulatory factor (Ser/Thr protein kinase)